MTGVILQDREFTETVIAADKQFSANKPLPLSVNGLSDGAKDAFFIETVKDSLSKRSAPVLVFVKDETEIAAVSSLLEDEDIPVLRYPRRDFTLMNIAASHDTERERLSALASLLYGEGKVVVTTPSAALQYTMPEEVLRENSLTLRRGDNLDLRTLTGLLQRQGYALTDTVESVGQYAVRGGILDVFPASVPLPVRLEFFGDEIDRMEYFDPVSQRVSEFCPGLSLLPAKEILPGEEEIQKILKAEEALCGKAGAETFLTLSGECEALKSGLPVHFFDRYVSLIYPLPGTLFSYVRERALCFVYSDTGIKEHTEKLLALLFEEGSAITEKGLLPPKYNRFAGEYGEFEDFLRRNVSLYIAGFGHSLSGETGGLFGFRTRRSVSYFGKEKLLSEDVHNLLSVYYRVILVAENQGSAESLAGMCRENGIDAFVTDGNLMPDYALLNQGKVAVVCGRVASGFELLTPKIAVLSLLPDEAARRKRNRRTVKIKRPAGQKIMSYADLSVGDYVTHAVHGIGVFEGMEQITVDGVTRDYITLRYDGNDKLFLPADRLELIAKYIGAKSENGTVKLSKLGGKEWGKSKSRAKAAAKDMAKKLVELYAARQRKPGFAFPEDSDMERDFADSFEFEETDPQLVAIGEITGDMTRPVPMDRLLCGDVGFGKTEVALRAAFKAICAGKQVAILVPTTILALQHYQTVVSRMRGYPVNVAMLSRLRTPKERAVTLKRLARGEVDLVIGTHSLLSSSVTFRDLGLLIVDEEQRFGVGQKEKLKTLAENVDVLTLTATPIPRTLNMAMSGIRDMSVLDEPPADRQPAQTYVLEHDDVVIEDAIRRELGRGGQVLYLYNRVETIERPAAKLASAFPDARIAVAHGKMEKDELEDIWQSLIRGEIDILVCTTIVETGVDLPNANTLIIEDADRMGLSQLHQLRGRVGRSGRRAYAYFTYRRGRELTDIAEKRLKAIQEFAEFGAGFKIALRDLEIRGAGNLLGAEQHGHIDSIGYDLYVKILNEAILEEKGEQPAPAFETAVELSVDANIPTDYILPSA
ncbi:MAG: transcription-repair coupling factor, partial [Clostridia bacterium]|nr:transcription-repair coupling factor [Clostridia bacterium]